jgi:hypothetical protein
MGRTETMRVEVKIVCPFCGGTAELGFEGALHSLPACRAFEDMTVEDYVHEVHEIFQKTKRPGDQRS